MSVPIKPMRLTLWIAENGRPNELRVEYRPTGADTAETVVVLAVSAEAGGKKRSIEVQPTDIGTGRYSDETVLKIGHASIVDLTDEGRKRVEAWKAWNRSEAGDIAEYKRLKAKFKGGEPA